MSKRYYKARMLRKFRIIIGLLLVFFLFILFESTLNDPTFLAMDQHNMMDLFKFHLKYPQELITFFVAVFMPAIYFSYIRGTVFYEDKIVLNHGIPFVNSTLHYENIVNYNILHPKYLLSIKTNNEKQYLITTNDIDRVISILDKQGIKGKLSDEEYRVSKKSGKKVFVYLLVFVCLMAFLQKMGAFRWIYRG